MSPTAFQVQVRSFVSQAPRIILGSASSSRKLIMDELAVEYPGLTYHVKTADIDEKAIRHDDPHDLVLALGRAKRDAILAKLQAEGSHACSTSSATAPAPRPPGSCGGPFLITGDQVVLHKGKILEKPESAEEAREFIRGYWLAPPSTVGSVLCTDVTSGYSCEAVDVSTVYLKEIPEHVVDKIIEEGEWRYCAGGLMIEHPLVVPFIERIDGTDDGVRGLSKALVLTLLLEAAGVTTKLPE